MKVLTDFKTCTKVVRVDNYLAVKSFYNALPGKLVNGTMYLLHAGMWIAETDATFLRLFNNNPIKRLTDDLNSKNSFIN